MSNGSKLPRYIPSIASTMGFSFGFVWFVFIGVIHQALGLQVFKMFVHTTTSSKHVLPMLNMLKSLSWTKYVLRTLNRHIIYTCCGPWTETDKCMCICCRHWSDAYIYIYICIYIYIYIYICCRYLKHIAPSTKHQHICCGPWTKIYISCRPCIDTHTHIYMYIYICIYIHAMELEQKTRKYMLQTLNRNILAAACKL